MQQITLAKEEGLGILRAKHMLLEKASSSGSENPNANESEYLLKEKQPASMLSNAKSTNIKLRVSTSRLNHLQNKVQIKGNHRFGKYLQQGWQVSS